MSKDFLDDDLSQSFPHKSMPIMPSGNIPSGLNQGIQELTPELLDGIINNPNEHPEVRANAQATKNRIFGQPLEETIEEEEEELAIPEKVVPKIEKKTKKKKTTKKAVKKATPKVEPKPIIKVEEPTPPPTLESVNASEESVMSFIGNIEQSLYNDEVELLSETTKIQLKSLSVEEYKFLTKHLEMFENDMKRLGDDNDRLKEQRELVLTNALDVPLQRCITNGYPVAELTVFDWLYLLLTLRCVSRPSDTTFRVTFAKDGERVEKRINFDVMGLIDYLRQERDRFITNPLGYIEMQNDMGLYLMLPTRGDMKFIEQAILNDPEATVSILSVACAVKAFVKDGKAHMMSPEQRIRLFNTLDYETVSKIKKAYHESYGNFFSVVNEYFKSQSPEDMEAIEFSDFILYLYDF